MLLFLFCVVYVVVGIVMYANDVFDEVARSTSFDIVDAISFALIGGAIIMIRVFRNCIRVLECEIETVVWPECPQFLIDIKNGFLSIFK